MLPIAQPRGSSSAWNGHGAASGGGGTTLPITARNELLFGAERRALAGSERYLASGNENLHLEVHAGGMPPAPAADMDVWKDMHYRTDALAHREAMRAVTVPARDCVLARCRKTRSGITATES